MFFLLQTSSSTFSFIAVAEVEIVSGVTRDDGSRENNNLGISVGEVLFCCVADAFVTLCVVQGRQCAHAQ